MNSYDSLLKEYNSLPSGNVYKKVIKGREYLYYQYSKNGKKYTRHVTDEEGLELLGKIIRKKTLGFQLKEEIRKNTRNFVLSQNAREFTGYVMSSDKVVAEFNHGQLVKQNEKLVPLIIKRTHSLSEFLKLRVIDTSRNNARILKKVLGIHEDKEEYLSLCSYAASITDNYWFKPKRSKLKYQAISFNSDIYFDTSLRGIITIMNRNSSPSPDLTTGGSYEKGWKLVDGEWWLYKKGNNNEYISELFYAYLMEELGVPTAHYEMDENYIRTKNFAKGYNYEPLASIMGEDEDYNHVLDKLLEINVNIAEQYLVLIYYDTILNNVDRHNQNCGLLRDQKTGQIISLAPNFDDNMCLISRDDELNRAKNEGFLSYFLNFIKRNNKAKELYQSMDLPVIDEKILDRVIKKIPFDFDSDKVKEFILNRYQFIKEEVDK